VKPIGRDVYPIRSYYWVKCQMSGVRCSFSLSWRFAHWCALGSYNEGSGSCHCGLAQNILFK